jgi:hypothetical protein
MQALTEASPDGSLRSTQARLKRLPRLLPGKSK